MLKIPIIFNDTDYTILYDESKNKWDLCLKANENDNITAELSLNEDLEDLTSVGKYALGFLTQFLENNKQVVNKNICRCDLQDILMLGAGHRADCPEKKIVKRYRY